jgi:hypothetical protein
LHFLDEKNTRLKRDGEAWHWQSTCIVLDDATEVSQQLKWKVRVRTILRVERRYEDGMGMKRWGYEDLGPSSPTVTRVRSRNIRDPVTGVDIQSR